MVNMASLAYKDENSQEFALKNPIAMEIHKSILDELSDDQKQAMTEFGDMRIDFGLPMHDPPVYDVADRVRMLNEQLAQQNAAEAGSASGGRGSTEVRSPRRRSIKFKENLVDLEVPPPPSPPPSPLPSPPTSPTYQRRWRDRSSSQSSSSSDYDDRESGGDRVRFLDVDASHQTPATTTTTTPSSSSTPMTSCLATPPSCDGFDSALSDEDDGVADLEAPYETKLPAPSATLVGSDSSGIDEVEHGGSGPLPSVPSYIPSTTSTSTTATTTGSSRGPAPPPARPKTAPHRRSVEFDSTPRRLEEREQQMNASSSSSSAAGKQVLIERNGSFSLVDIASLTLEEKELYGVEAEQTEQDSSPTKQPSPPNSQRPSSAPSPRRHRHHRHAPSSSHAPNSSADIGGGARPQTAYTDNYRSPYAMDPEAKRDLTKRTRAEQRQAKDDQHQRDCKLERTRYDACQAFEHWLKVKKEAAEQDAKDRKNKRLEDENIARKRKEERNSNWFNAWMKDKRKELHDKKIKEKQKQCIIQESNRKSHEETVKLKNAYRNWIKNKNCQLREANNSHKLLKRRSRRSKSCTRSSGRNQQYVDYYGYRY